jgi:exonuclease III
MRARARARAPCLAGASRARLLAHRRARARPFNRGLRLDYFLASAALAGGGAGSAGGPRLHDAFILDTATDGVSDHAPVGVTLAL